MKLTIVQVVGVLLGAIALVFAFLAAGAAAASALLAFLAGAGLVWLAWRVIRHRVSHPRDRTA